MLSFQFPLTPKNPDGILRVLVIGRVSTVMQDVENINASYRQVEEMLRKSYQGEMRVKHLGEQGSGMLTDRASIVEAEEEIATGEWDLVIMEDLSKPYRNPRFQYAFVQNCVDHETRLISLGDNIDTVDPHWEVTMGAAVLRHGLHIPDTRRRVRRTANHSFHRGGMALKIPFGYRKLTKEEAESGQFGTKGLRLAKIPEKTPVLHEMKRRLLTGQSLELIADGLNDEEIAPGRYATSGKWTGRLVADTLRNSLLAGTRTFPKVIHTPIFSTGKHRRQANPQPEFEHYPELAHFSAEEYQELVAYLDRDKLTHSAAKGKESPRYRVPPAHSIWPAQQMRCALCGSLLYRTLNDQLKCQNAFRRSLKPCGNHVQVHAEQARTKVIPLIIGWLKQNPAAWRTFLDAAWSEFQHQIRKSQTQLKSYDDAIKGGETKAANLSKAIAAGGPMEALVKELKEVEKSLKALRQKRKETETQSRETIPVLTPEELAESAESCILHLAKTSFSFAALLRRVIPKFVIKPIQALDSGLVRPRAHVTFRPSAFGDEKSKVLNADQEPGDITFVVDLFDPPEHIRHLAACLRTKASNPDWSLKKIAAHLAIGYMTVKRAFDYARLMRQEELTSPYRELTAAPENASRWKQRVRKDNEGNSDDSGGKPTA